MLRPPREGECFIVPLPWLRLTWCFVCYECETCPSECQSSMVQWYKQRQWTSPNKSLSGKILLEGILYANRSSHSCRTCFGYLLLFLLFFWISRRPEAVAPERSAGGRHRDCAQDLSGGRAHKLE